MARLSLTLLGGFQGRLEPGAAIALPTRKALALLAYLALTPGQAHPRDKLAALLWGGMREEGARSSLRQALFALRKALATSEPPAFLVERDTIALDRRAVSVDVVELERLLADGTPDALARAASLYRGDLLAGLAIDEAPFEEWLLGERERLREAAMEGLAKLLAHQRNAGLLDAATQTALRLLSIDPLQEPVHRTLMRLYAGRGRRGSALRQYQLCVNTLQRELGVEPEPETKHLYQEILRQRPAAHAVDVHGDHPASRSPGGTPTDEPVPRTGREALATETPLIGRDLELATLRDALAGAVSGPGRVVALLGEAGVGKSRLLEELALDARQRGARVLVGRAYESAQILPFGPWVDALRSPGLIAEAAVRGGLSPVWRAELARLFPELTTPEQPAAGADYLRLFESVCALVAHVAAEKPLVVILEDLHWADEMSLRLLPFVGRRLRVSPVLLIGTARDEELADAEPLRRALEDLHRVDSFAELKLAPLSRLDTSRLVRFLTEARSEAAAVQRLEEQVWVTSEGNPFVVVETLRAVREGLPLPPTETLSVPARVRDVIAARVERLSEESRELLRLAAVIGREFDFALLQRASGLTDRDAARSAEELVRRRLLHGVDEGFDFTHDRIREVVYAGLLPPRRKLLHRDVAVALEALTAGALDPPADALGLHYRLAEIPGKAQLWLTTAGDIAARKYATATASRCYEAALALADRPLDRASLHERIGDIHMLQWSGDAGVIHHGRALEMWQAAGASDQSLGARLYAKVAEAATRWRGAFKVPPAESEVIRWIEAGLELVGHREPSIEKARLMMARATLPNFTGRWNEAEVREAIACGEAVLPVVEALGTPRDVSAVLCALGSAHTFLADYPAALDHHLRRRDLGRRVEDRAELIDIACMLAQAYAAVGRYDDAVREAEGGAELGRIGLGVWYIHALHWRTWAHFAWDRWDAATQSFEEFRRAWESYDRVYMASVGELLLIQAVVLARRGRHEEAGALALQAQHYAVRRMLHLPALLLMAQGRLADARAVLEEVAAGRGRLIPAVHAHLLEIQARTGDPCALAAADRVLALATRAGARKEIAQTHRALAIALRSAGDSSAAATHFADAVRGYQDLGTRWEVAQTLRDWARAIIESEGSASKDRALAMSDTALAIFREMGDRRSAEDVNAQLGR